MKIRDMLLLQDAKHHTVFKISPNETVSAAVQKLAEHDRGSLPVCDEEGRLVGIISESDVVKRCLAPGVSCADITVDNIMTRQVAVLTLEDDTDNAISVMKQKKVRHLPILDGQKVVGMISIWDLLGLELEECKAHIRYTDILPKAHSPRRLV